jgi:hypothetical protein
MIAAKGVYANHAIVAIMVPEPEYVLTVGIPDGCRKRKTKQKRRVLYYYFLEFGSDISKGFVSTLSCIHVPPFSLLSVFQQYNKKL